MNSRQKSDKGLNKIPSHEGRPLLHKEKKETHNITVTPTGWEGIKELAKETGFSVSEFIEQIGRRQIQTYLRQQSSLLQQSKPENTQQGLIQDLEERIRRIEEAVNISSSNDFSSDSL